MEMEEGIDTCKVKRRKIEVMIFLMSRSSVESGHGKMDAEVGYKHVEKMLNFLNEHLA